MPIIEFETKGDVAYLLVTSGEVGWFPGGLFGVTEHLLWQLEHEFETKGIRYRRLAAEEADEIIKENHRR
jgi:hypothetical protein